MYFKKFPNITWDNKTVVDITRRAAFLDKFRSNPYVFLPYTIAEEDTIESIANDFYGDPGLSWLIVVANDIIDPFTDFWKNQRTFEKFIVQKYRTEAEKSDGRYDADTYIPMKDNEVVEWTQNETITDNIVHYFNLANRDIIISKRTGLAGQDPNFFPLRIYDYEDEINEGKRNIFLISKNYVNQLRAELEKVLND